MAFFGPFGYRLPPMFFPPFPRIFFCGGGRVALVSVHCWVGEVPSLGLLVTACLRCLPVRSAILGSGGGTDSVASLYRRSDRANPRPIRRQENLRTEPH